MGNKIQCPKCSHSFEVTDVMAAKIKAELEEQFAEKEAEVNARASAQVIEERKKLEVQLRTERAKIEATLSKEIEDRTRAEVSDLAEQVREKDEKLRDAAAKELELRKSQRAVEESKRDLELTLTRRLDDERARIREEATASVTEELQHEKSRWDTQRESMERLIEDLKKKASQGSTQTQGEAFELEVEATLKEAFPLDVVEPVAKGVRGSDVLHRVQTRTGQLAGTIAWELKRTKAWTDSWIPKLKDDMRAAKAEVAVIITQTMPEGVRRIGQVEGVWVCDFQSFLGLALALRSSLLEVAQAKTAMVGRKEKLDYLYDYLSGAEFRGRIEAVVEAFTQMSEDLESERRAFEKIWAKREKSLTRAKVNTAGIYGDLQGLIGSSLQEIPALALEVK